MVGDYISTSFAGGSAHPVFAVANAPTGSTLDEAMYTPAGGSPPPSAPTVSLTSTPPSSTSSTNASFAWTTTGTVTSTTCSLDGGAPVLCASPKTYSGLSVGNHGFLVVVANSSGSSSAAYNWTVTPPPPPPGALTRLSADPFTNASSQHATQVEPDTFAFGSTIVAAFQSGRFFDGGSSDLGFATSTNSGGSWTNGFLPGLTKYRGAGPYDRVSDPAVAYDAAHHVWLIVSLALREPAVAGVAVLVSRSSDGLTWSNPVTVATGSNLDKTWIACDNTASSPFYGHCYSEWDDPADFDRIKLSTSTDGGASWGLPLNTGNNATGLGGQPVVQPNGQVIVPIMSASGSAILSFRSVDGGASWRSTVTVASISDHAVAGGLRSEPLPSAEVDGAGNVYVVWQDCRFRSGCTSNDIVIATTTQAGYPTWSGVSRIPIDSSTSSVDHFIPGLAVDPASSGSTAKLALAYYYYPQANCSVSTCQLDVGYVSSTNAGASWSAPSQLAGPMSLSWLPNTSGGQMVGDYISTSFAGGSAHPVFAVANAPTGSTLDEAMYTPAGGLP
jgi:hypothetical protein